MIHQIYSRDLASGDSRLQDTNSACTFFEGPNYSVQLSTTFLWRSVSLAVYILQGRQEKDRRQKKEPILHALELCTFSQSVGCRNLISPFLLGMFWMLFVARVLFLVNGLDETDVLFSRLQLEACSSRFPISSHFPSLPVPTQYDKKEIINHRCMYKTETHTKIIRCITLRQH